jgi:hypothetical protein
MEVSGRNQSSRVGYCSVYGLLSAYDNVLEIKVFIYFAGNAIDTQIWLLLIS